MPHVGDLREGNGWVEVFYGDAWRPFAPIPTGMDFAEASIRICAPLDATEEEIQRWIDRKREVA